MMFIGWIWNLKLMVVVDVGGGKRGKNERKNGRKMGGEIGRKILWEWGESGWGKLEWIGLIRFLRSNYGEKEDERGREWGREKPNTILQWFWHGFYFFEEKNSRVYFKNHLCYTNILIYK